MQLAEWHLLRWSHMHCYCHNDVGWPTKSSTLRLPSVPRPAITFQDELETRDNLWYFLVSINARVTRGPLSELRWHSAHVVPDWSTYVATLSQLHHWFYSQNRLWDNFLFIFFNFIIFLSFQIGSELTRALGSSACTPTTAMKDAVVECTTNRKVDYYTCTGKQFLTRISGIVPKGTVY